MPDNINILHLENDCEYSSFLNDQLNKISSDKDNYRFKFEVVKKPDDAIERILKNSYDCIICDYQIIGGTGLEFLIEARALENDTPVIFLAGQEDDDLAKNAFRHGANDYFLKKDEMTSFEIMYNAILNQIEHRRTFREKKEIEKKLAISENKYISLFQNANDAILLLDENGIIECNKMTESILGYPRDEIIGKKPYELSPRIQLDGRDSKKYNIEYLQRARDGQINNFLWIIRHKNGHLVRCRINLNVIQYEDDNKFIAIVREVSDNKNNDQMILNGDEKNLLLHNSPFNEGSLLLDADGRIIFLDSIIEKMFDLPSNMVVGKKLRDVIDPSMKKTYLEIYGRLMRDKNEVIFNTSIGGRSYTFYISPFIDGDGCISKIGIYAKDNTEFRSTEEELYKKLKSSNEVINSIPIGIYIFRYEPPNKLFLEDANPKAQCNSFLDMDFALNNEYSNVWISRSSALLKNELIRVAQSGVTFKDESYIYPIKNGTLYYSLTAFKLTNRKICLTEYDVTNIEKTKNELKRNRIFLENLISISKDINVLDLKFILERIANDIRRIVPYESLSFYKIDAENDVLIPIYANGTDCDKVMQYQASLHEGITGRVARNGVAEIVNDPYDDNSTILVPGTKKEDDKVMSIPLIGHKNTIGVLNLYRIGINFESEELDDIFVFVPHAAVAMENAILFDNLKKSKERTEFFMSMLAHDMKNCLSVSYGYTELLDEDTDIPDITSKLCHQYDSMYRLIDNAILFVKLEEGEINKKFVYTDINEVIIDAVKYYKYHPKHDNINLELHKKKCPIMALPILVNTFTNLIDNALKYANNCTIKVYDSKDKYNIDFIDDGNSIEEDKLKMLFKNYKRGAHSENIIGYGLGLSIVKKVVNLHNGDISVRSDKDSGTVFTVSLPITKEREIY